jgi:hypothetical protein
MFDYELRAEVKRVEVLVPKVDGPVAKACRITFRRELDVDIARALAGEFGVHALKQLHDRGITKIEFPIDAITARCQITGNGGQSPLLIGAVAGIKAVAKVKKLQEKKDPEVPIVELKFQFPYFTDAWEFLGENACTTVRVKLSRNQLELPLSASTPEATNGDSKPHGKRGRPKKGGGVLTSKSSHGDDHAEAAEEMVDAQDAATPEEAEELRAQRLREERSMEQGVWADEVH